MATKPQRQDRNKDNPRFMIHDEAGEIMDVQQGNSGDLYVDVFQADVRLDRERVQRLRDVLDHWLATGELENGEMGNDQ